MSKHNPGTKEDGWAGQQGQSGGIDNGCPNNCVYCYARLLKCRRKTKKSDGTTMTWDNWHIPTPRKTKMPIKHLELPNRFMFPSTHDIHLGNVNRCVDTIKEILSHDNDVLIVSKPIRKCIEYMAIKLDDFRPRIEFRFSIGTMDDRISAILEPHAPRFDERLTCIKIVRALGYDVSVSIEPYLDPYPDLIVREVDIYVSSIWVGTMNYLDDIKKYYPDIEKLSWLYIPRRVRRIKRELDSLNNPKIKYKTPFLIASGDACPKCGYSELLDWGGHGQEWIEKHCPECNHYWKIEVDEHEMIC